MKKKGYKSIPLSFNRQMVRASTAVNSRKHCIHSFCEIDISKPRALLKAHKEKTGKGLSFTAFIAAALARSLKDFPEFNSFIKGRRLILLDDLTISVLVESEQKGEKFPQPAGIQQAQKKTFLQIHQEIRAAQETSHQEMGKMSGMSWIKYIPSFLLKFFVTIADQNISLGKKYGKVAITAVGMFCRQPVWFVPHGSATVLLTVGSINKKLIQIDNKLTEREHLCLTVTFDHDIVDGAPAARFMDKLSSTLREADFLEEELKN